MGTVDRRAARAGADRPPARAAGEPRRAPTAVRDPAAPGGAPARNPGRLRRSEAELQDPPRLLRLPERPGQPVDAARPLAGPPAAPARGALRRPGAGRAHPRAPAPGRRSAPRAG